MSCSVDTHVSQRLKKVLDKLEFVEPIQAHVVRGILSPEGGIFLAQGAAAIAAEPWVWYKE